MSFATVPGGMDASWFILVGLLALRVAAVFAMTPVLYALALPASVRMLLVLCLSVSLASGLAVPTQMPHEWRALLAAASSELALGAVFGLGVLLAFCAFSVAGQVLDVQLGYGMAQIVDPLTSRPVPILTTAFSHASVVVFFLVNGHHALLRGIAYSVVRFPVGAPWSALRSVEPVLKQAAGLFTLGFALAAPMVSCILLTEFALGVVGRSLPQMNVFAMGVSVKIVVGLVALSLWFTNAGGVMTRVYAGIVASWDQIFWSAPPPTAR